MKARRIATHRIGDTQPTPRKANRNTSLAFKFAVVMVLVVLSIALMYVKLTMPTVHEVLRITVIATLAPTQTTLPTSTIAPTALPITLTPLPTIAIERGVMLAQVWLYDAPGGNKLTAGLLKGQSVTVLEHREDFVKVLWDGGDTAIVGWVAERWIEIK